MGSCGRRVRLTHGPCRCLQIDMKTGHKVDKDLCGGVCESKDQKQRTYQVYTDGDKIQ